MGRERPIAQPVLLDRHSVHSPKSAERQLVRRPRRRCARRSAAGDQDRRAVGTCRCARARCRAAPATTRRLDQQRQEPEDGQLGRRAVHELSYGDARTDAVRYEPVRENCDVPRPARVVERSHAVVRMPMLCQRCHIASKHPRRSTIRTDHHQQEQPDVRTVVCQHHSNVRLDHPSGQFFMR
jgi:hypothetical protein